MGFLKYLVPALAAASHVAYASGCDGPVTIQNQGDADSLQSCTTIKGDFVIAPQTSEGITLNGVGRITGSLKVDGAANLTSFSAPELSEIGDTFLLNGLILLTNLDLPSLTAVGTVTWSALPNLQALSFAQGISKAGSVSITNTGLTSLDGINLQSVGLFDITANTALTQVNVNDITNCSGLLNFAGNSPKLSVELPNLGTGTNITFRNASSVSLPSLKKLSGQLGLFGNNFKEFQAPNLTNTGDLVFDNNPNLASISLPQLTKINGGFQIAGNDQLVVIDGVPNLQTIVGALDFSGAFNNVSLPDLGEVKGGFNMQSSGNFQCSDFDTLRTNSVIQGSYTCKSSTSNPTTMDGSSGTSTGSGSAASSSKSSASNLANTPIVGLTAMVGAILQAML